jgi:hypothetical protein
MLKGDKGEEDPKEPEPRAESALVEEFTSKMRKAMKYLAGLELSVDEILPVAKKSKYCSKQLHADLLNHKQVLNDSQVKAKKIVLKNDRSSDKLKEFLLEMASTAKNAQNTLKEMRHVCKDSDQLTSATKKSKK